MLCLTDSAKEKMKEVLPFAIENDCLEPLLNQLQHLSRDPEGNTRCTLFNDFAPLSFAFTLERMRQDDHEWHPMYNGGFLYSGPGQKLDGSAPALSVSLNQDANEGSKHMWSIHT